MFYVYFLMAGVFAGLLSGLLGIGGGVVVVPVLLFLFMKQGFSSQVVMPLSVGTSLSIMIFTTARALFAHMKHEIEFWSVARRLMIPVIIGVVMGGVLAHYLHSHILISFFAAFLLIVAVRMFKGSRANEKRQLPGVFGLSSVGIGIGALSGLFGIGGGSTVIPFLSSCNVPIRQAVMVSFCMGMVIAFVGTITFVIAGQHNVLLPVHSLGYVYWPAWLTITTGSIIAAPIGAHYSHRLPADILRKVFAVFLLMVSIHMIWGIAHASLSTL